MLGRHAATSSEALASVHFTPVVRGVGLKFSTRRQGSSRVTSPAIDWSVTQHKPERSIP